jgi:hypothetical protein
MANMTSNLLLRAFFISLLFSFLFSLTGCASSPTADTDAGRKAFADKWGIEVDAIRLTAGNYMLDFRYRVVDAEKASQIIGPKTRPFLVDQASGVKLDVPTPPKIGPLRQTRSRPVAGKSYFIFFANPGQYVKTGSKVTVVMSNLRIENLTVQ